MATKALLKDFKRRGKASRQRIDCVNARREKLRELDSSELKARQKRYQKMIKSDKETETQALLEKQVEAANVLNEATHLEIPAAKRPRRNTYSTPSKPSPLKPDLCKTPAKIATIDCTCLSPHKVAPLKTFERQFNVAVYGGDGDHGVHLLPSHVVDWIPLAREVTRVCATNQERSARGEFNEVLLNVRQLQHLFPNLKELDFDRVVVRVTRSDSEPVKFEQKGDKVDNEGDKEERGWATPTVRYRSLNYQLQEMRTTLFASANGFAVPVHAAFVFPGPTIDGKLLYGALYVMYKADCSLYDFIFDAPRHISDVFGVSKHSPECKVRVARSVGDMASGLLSTIVKQSHAGLATFDLKPGNVLVCDGGDGTALSSRYYASDFDSCLASLLECDFDPDELVLGHMLLMLTHIRTFSKQPVVKGFVTAWRPFLLQLAARVCKTAQTNRRAWLWNAKMSRHSVTIQALNSPTRLRTRFLAVVGSYFACHSRARFYRCAPDFLFDPDAPPAVQQMLAFTLCGDSGHMDPELERLFAKRHIS